MIDDLDHIGVVVADLSASRLFVTEVLGLDHRDSVEIPGRLRAEFFSMGGFELELIEITEPKERAARLREGARATLEHVALRAHDVAATVEALQARGVEFDGGGVQSIAGRCVAFTVPATTEGVRYQLVEPRSPGS